MSNAKLNDTNAIITSKKRVACDGGGGALGHPKTWLDMGTDNQVTCKYCGQVFQLDPGAIIGGGH